MPETRPSSSSGLALYSTWIALPFLRQKTSSRMRIGSARRSACRIGLVDREYGVPSAWLWWMSSCRSRPVIRSGAYPSVLAPASLINVTLPSRSMPKMPSPTDSRISSRCRVARCSASSASYCSVTSMPCTIAKERSPASCMLRLCTAKRRYTPSLRRNDSAPCHSSSVSTVFRQSWNVATPVASINSVSMRPTRSSGRYPRVSAVNAFSEVTRPSIEQVKTNPKLFSTISR